LAGNYLASLNVPSVLCMAADSTGNVFVSTGPGLRKFSPSNVLVLSQDFLPRTYNPCATDSSGDLYCGSANVTGRYVWKLSGSNFSTISAFATNFSSSPISIVFDALSQLHVVYLCRIQVLTTAGSVVRELDFNSVPSNCPGNIAFNSKGQYVFSSGLVVDLNGNVLASSRNFLGITYGVAIDSFDNNYFGSSISTVIKLGPNLTATCSNVLPPTTTAITTTGPGGSTAGPVTTPQPGGSTFLTTTRPGVASLLSVSVLLLLFSILI
jgi:hypothetical protein